MKIASVTLLFLAISCGTGLHEVAVAAKTNVAATEKNAADYETVVIDLTNNLTLMHDKQLQLLASRELRKINLLPDETERLAKTEQLLENQSTARNTFRAKMDAYVAKALAAPNFKIAAMTSAAVSRYVGTIDEAAADVNTLLDQLGISIEKGEVPKLELP